MVLCLGAHGKGCFRYILLVRMDRLEVVLELYQRWEGGRRLTAHSGRDSSDPTHRAASMLGRNLIAGGSRPWGEEQQLEAQRWRFSEEPAGQPGSCCLMGQKQQSEGC